MAKGTDNRRGGFDVGETGGALSGLLADEEELDRGALWRLGTWAAVSVGAVIVALIANQSSIGVRREQSASADLLKQAQQLQLTTRESQNETRRLSSAVDTLNSDRDRLYSRVAVLEQGLDSVTGAISRQSAASPAPQGSGQVSASQISAGQTSANLAGPGQGSSSQAGANQGTATQSVASTAAPTISATAAQTTPVLPAAPAATASIDPSATVVKPTPVPVTASVATTAPAVADKAAPAAKQDKQAATAVTSEPGSSAKSATEPQAIAAQPSGSLVASKSMMAPPDPAAGKLLEPPSLPKIPPSVSMLEVASVAPKASDEPEAASSAAAPELVASRTEFGVDIGGANSIPGLRALWRGLLKSRSNGALAKLRPIIVIKENNNGLGMQLRLVAGPINDAAAAAKICASLTVSDRGCSTAVFEGQRLALGADEADKADAGRPEAAKPEIGDKSPSGVLRSSSHRHYYSSKRPKTVEDAPPKPEQSTFSSLIFGKRQ